MADEETRRQLETLIALFKLVHRDEIERARVAIRTDKVNAAILDGSRKFTAAGKLRTAVMKKSGVGSSTFSDRIADLIEMGVLEKQGGGPTTEYRATGLI